jgi:hypothetical protein
MNQPLIMHVDLETGKARIESGEPLDPDAYQVLAITDKESRITTSFQRAE